MRGRRIRRTIRAVRNLLVALVAVAAAVVVLTAATVVQHARRDEARTADAIMVLGAAQFDGRPQAYLVARLEHALELFEAGSAPRIVTVGGKQPGDRFTEAEAGQHWLEQRGVPAVKIIDVGHGKNTLGSIRSAAEVMTDHDWSSAIVVTDPWHELRSTTMLADQGITAYGSPTRTGPSVDGTAVKVRYVARETIAYLAYVADRTWS